MKKILTLGILILFVFGVTGCAVREEIEIVATVIQCEEGEYHPDPSYQAIANMCFSEKKYTMWNMYTKLANDNGSYDYNILVNIEGEDYIIVCSEKYEIGEEIIVKQVRTYKGTEVIETEYK